MIELSSQAIFVQGEDGCAVPFEAGRLTSLICGALPHGIDDPETLAMDAACAVEYTLRHARKPGPGPLYVKTEAIAGMVTNILRSIGMDSAAVAFAKLFRCNEPDNRNEAAVAAFLSETLSLQGEQLHSVTRKVRNTLRSIGADIESKNLILELGRHFVRTSEAAGTIPLILPIRHPHDGISLVMPEEFMENLTSESLRLLDKSVRAVRVRPIDLRVFPTMRVELRLFPLLRSSGLEIPVTELAFAPLLSPVAICLDEVCIAADAVCRRHGCEDATPLKLFLHFPDAGEFAMEVMGCSGLKAASHLINDLAGFFSGMITRHPEKITFL